MEIIKLKTCNNIRDISYGKIIPKKLIRSSAPTNISSNDIKILKEQYNVTTIIDLRMDSEFENQKINIKDIEYHHIPLISTELSGITHSNSDLKLERLITKTPNLSNLYLQIVSKDKKEQWKKIFEIFLNNKSGAIMWFCHYGKDRCGVVSFLLEYALGLNFYQIKKDYMLSNRFYKTKVKETYNMVLKKTGKKKKARNVSDLYKAKREYIESAINYIIEEYGNMDNFLKEMCDIDEKKLKKLREIYLK